MVPRQKWCSVWIWLRLRPASQGSHPRSIDLWSSRSQHRILDHQNHRTSATASRGRRVQEEGHQMGEQTRVLESPSRCTRQTSFIASSCRIKGTTGNSPRPNVQLNEQPSVADDAASTVVDVLFAPRCNHDLLTTTSRLTPDWSSTRP